MPNTFFVSDTHFGHDNIIKFVGENGSRIRPFDSVEEMDELLVKNWNEIVRPQDRIYHLGDVVMNHKHMPIMSRLNGKKVLIKGNHDIFKLDVYTPYFEDIRAYKVLPKHGIICSHIPVHESQLEHRFKWNVHGHTHEKFVKGRDGMIDLRYINVCVETTHWRPLSLEHIMREITLDEKLLRMPYHAAGQPGQSQDAG